MELLKKNIHMSRRKAYGENRMTLSEDFNIPDKKPDAAGLIQKRGEVKLEEVRTTEGQVQLSGTLEVHILYVSEGDERRLCRIQAEFPFEEKLLLPGAAAGDSAVGDHGRIVAHGTHDRLLAACPLYASMWQAHVCAKAWSAVSRKEALDA